MQWVKLLFAGFLFAGNAWGQGEYPGRPVRIGTIADNTMVSPEPSVAVSVLPVTRMRSVPRTTAASVHDEALNSLPATVKNAW